MFRFVRGLWSPLGIAEIRRQIPGISRKSHNFSFWCTLMASDEHDTTRIHRFDTKSLCRSPSTSDDSQVGQDSSDPDYYFSSNENQGRRPSTVEDEERAKNLLKEILAYRETNVSSWIVEVCMMHLFEINIRVNLFTLFPSKGPCNRFDFHLLVFKMY